MPVLRVKAFSGIVPVSGDRELPDAFAVAAVNTWLYGKELRGTRAPLDVIALQAGTRKAFRIPKGTVGGDPTYPDAVPPPSYLGDSVWVQFDDPDTDIVRGQLIEDQHNRWYFCSPSTGPVFNTRARLESGLPMYKLGVPGPQDETNKPALSLIIGGSPPVVTRSYVYTWVNIYGEESNPSLPVTAAGNADGEWLLTDVDDPPAAPDYAPYDHKVIYRTVTGASGQTTYYKVAEIPIGTTTYEDDGAVNTDAVIVNNLRLESTTWDVPPDDLQGFIAMPNGFLIGFSDNNVYMSESYRFHAWPPEYKQASEFPIVGLGILGQTCVVCTQGYPATITGSKPATTSFTKATTGEPALSRGSIVSTPSGVLYASQNGLQIVSPSGIVNVTEQLITRDEWVRDYVPQFLRAARYQEGYLGLRAYPDEVTPNSAFYIDPTDLRVALTELSDFEDKLNVFVDYWSGELLVLEDGMVSRWDPPSTDFMPVLWKSKEFQFQFEANFGAYAIYWDDARWSTVDYGQSILPDTDKIRFRVWANRTLIYDQLVPKNGKPIRLPSGFKADIWQFEIAARVPVYSLHVASTVKELRLV